MREEKTIFAGAMGDGEKIPGQEILRGLVGSGVHGTAIEGQDDRDEMGVCLESADYVIGLRHFEQYIYRTQPEGVRSGAGDLDLTVYSARKYLRLAAQGNPTVLLLLYVPEHLLVVAEPLGMELRELAPSIASRQAAPRFLGYLTAQKDRLLGIRGGGHGKRGGARRDELITAHGFDTKYAMHMVRLGYQGVEFLTTGRITLPMPEPQLSYCRALRMGNIELNDALHTVGNLELALKGLHDSSPLPEKPDYEAINEWLRSAYIRSWDEA